jgi:tryptophan synthase alpha chain
MSPRENRLERELARRRQGLQKSLAPYVVAGDGGIDTTVAVLRALAEVRGVACVELGIPFSDPIADGPVLQAANERALMAGTTFAKALEALARFRMESELPVAVMSYANPILRRGWAEACLAIASAGGDALLVADLPIEEGAEMAEAARARNLCPIFFVSPTTSDERMRRAAAASRGFVYAIGRFGVTGADGADSGKRKRDHASPALEGAGEIFLRRVRSAAGNLPVAVGFGIGTADQVAASTRAADVAIVGSALVQRASDAFTASEASPAAAADAARAFASELAKGLAP